MLTPIRIFRIVSSLVQDVAMLIRRSSSRKPIGLGFDDDGELV